MHDAEIVGLTRLPQFFDRTVAAGFPVDQPTTHMGLAVPQHMEERTALPVLPSLLVVPDGLKFVLAKGRRQIVFPHQRPTFVQRMQRVYDDEAAAESAVGVKAAFGEASHKRRFVGSRKGGMGQPVQNGVNGFRGHGRVLA